MTGFGAGRERWRGGAGGVLLLLATLAWGAPADEHQRGLGAYHRGDVVTAIAALRPAARAGHAPSQALLAFLLERADVVDEAAALYAAAAAQDDAEGLVGLAQLRLEGRGVAKDEKQALLHFSKAAALGHAGATEQVALAWLDSRWGADPAAEPARAAAALRRAAALGHARSIEALARAAAGPLVGEVDAAEAARWQQRLAETPRAPAVKPARTR